MRWHKTAQAYFKKHPLHLHALIVLSFIALTFYYLTPSFTNCTTAVHGFGDSTAGPIWRYQVNSSSPLWGPEKMSNYPFGDDLYSPIHFSGLLQYTYFWTVAHVTGPVCAYNVVNIVGFVSAASVMYGFIFYLTKRRSIAWIAGYVVSFTPYFQVKVGGHPSYGYQALFIGVLWAALALIKTPTLRKSLLLGALITTCFYYDPYFSLLMLSVLLPLVGLWGLLALKSILSTNHISKVVKKQFFAFAASAFFVGIALIPLAYVRIKYAAKISDAVLVSRSNVIETARVCSNYPHEYVLPFPLHPVITKTLTSPEELKLRSNIYSFSTCGIAEDAVGISLVVIGCTLVSLIIMAWDKLNKRSLHMHTLLSYDPKYVIYGSMLIALLAASIAFPPAKFLFIPTPSYAILKFVDIWRIVAREYIVINIAMTILFAVSLTFLAATLRNIVGNKVLRIGFVLILLVIFVEYQAYAPFKGNTHSGFDYREAPKAYYWLKEQSYRAIAEYPNERIGAEADASVYYQTMQSVHKKPIFNTALSDNPTILLHASLKNLKDPQTVPTLASLGIDAIVIHGVDKDIIENIPYLDIVYAGDHQPDLRVPPTPRVSTQDLVIAKIVNAPQIDTLFRFSEQPPFNHTIVTSAVDWNYEIVSGNSLRLTNILSGEPTNSAKDLCFNLRSVNPAIQVAVELYDKGILKATYTAAKDPVQVRLQDVSDVRFITSNKDPVVLTSLGCPQ